MPPLVVLDRFHEPELSKPHAIGVIIDTVHSLQSDLSRALNASFVNGFP